MKKKPTITPEMGLKGFRYLAECAGLDFENDSFNPDHVGRLIFEKGFEAGFLDAQRIAAKKAEQVTEPAP
jgi:hypothetical protein